METSFVNRMLSISLVANVLDFFNKKYTALKSTNGSLKGLLEGAELKILNGTKATFEATKILIPYEALDKLASNLLHKAEQLWPIKCLYQSQVVASSEENGSSNVCTTTPGGAFQDASSRLLSIAQNSMRRILSSTKNTYARLSAVTLTAKSKALAAIQQTRAMVEKYLGTSWGNMISFMESSLSRFQDKISIEPTNENHFSKLVRRLALTLVRESKLASTKAKETSTKIAEEAETLWIKVKAFNFATVQVARQMGKDLYLKANHTWESSTVFVHKFVSHLMASITWHDPLPNRESFLVLQPDATTRFENGAETPEGNTTPEVTSKASDDTEYQEIPSSPLSKRVSEARAEVILPEEDKEKKMESTEIPKDQSSLNASLSEDLPATKLNSSQLSTLSVDSLSDTKSTTSFWSVFRQ